MSQLDDFINSNKGLVVMDDISDKQKYYITENNDVKPDERKLPSTISELTEDDMISIAAGNPVWMFRTNPHFMAFYKPEWCCRFQPEWMTENYPDIMIKLNKSWMGYKRPDIMFFFDREWLKEYMSEWLVQNRQDTASYFYPELVEEYCSQRHEELRPELNGGRKLTWKQRIVRMVKMMFGVAKPIGVPEEIRKLLK